jgi:hypothetical protein
VLPTLVATGALAELGFGKYRQRTGGHGRRIGSMFGIGALLSEDGMEFIGLASVRSSAIYPQDSCFLRPFFIVFFAIIKFLFMSHTA